MLPAAGVGNPTTDDVEADVPEAASTKTPGRRGPGRKQKQVAGAEAAAIPLGMSPLGMSVEQASAKADPPATGPGQVPVEGDAQVAERAVPPDDAGAGDAAHGGIHLDEAAPGDVLSFTAPAKAAQAAPAARWNQVTDTVEFNWSAIERVAAQGSPNQAIAKLLVAARAKGASSRWPF